MTFREATGLWTISQTSDASNILEEYANSTLKMEAKCFSQMLKST
jgi:hypothetical protein